MLRIRYSISGKVTLCTKISENVHYEKKRKLSGVMNKEQAGYLQYRKKIRRRKKNKKKRLPFANLRFKINQINIIIFFLIFIFCYHKKQFYSP